MLMTRYEKIKMPNIALPLCLRILNWQLITYIWAVQIQHTAFNEHGGIYEGSKVGRINQVD